MAQKKAGMNRHQKAVYKVGERRTSRVEIEEMLEMSCSANAEERLIAAEHLCPCHVRMRIPAVWDALFRMMEDEDRRVRQAAWHTIEDGGKPGDEEAVARLERLCIREADPQIRRFAERTLDKTLGPRKQKDLAVLRIAHRAPPGARGKCDFCGETDVWVERDLQTMIPGNDLPRSAQICAKCKEAA